jgi:hypothetical protein
MAIPQPYDVIFPSVSNSSGETERIKESLFHLEDYANKFLFQFEQTIEQYREMGVSEEENKFLGEMLVVIGKLGSLFTDLYAGFRKALKVGLSEEKVLKIKREEIIPKKQAIILFTVNRKIYITNLFIGNGKFTNVGQVKYYLSREMQNMLNNCMLLVATNLEDYPPVGLKSYHDFNNDGNSSRINSSVNYNKKVLENVHTVIGKCCDEKI